MKRFLAAVLLALATAANGATPNVQVTLPALDAAALLDSTVTLVPMQTAAPTSALHLTLPTDASGVVTFTNVPAGRYRMHMANSGIRDLKIIVPGTSGTVLAESIIDPMENWTAPAGVRGYISSRGVRILMPPTNGLAGQVLSDIDGLGGLGWKTASGGAEMVWTNDNDIIYPIPDPPVSSGSPSIVRLLGPGNEVLDGGTLISVIGSNNTISNNAQDAFVIGENNIGNRLRGGSSGTSIVIGGNNIFAGTGRFVFGHDNQDLNLAGDSDDFVIGANNSVSGGFTWCVGDGNTVTRTGGNDVLVFGQNLIATNNSVLLFGRNLTSTNDGQVIFGDASNAIEIYSGGAIKLRGTMTILNTTNQVVFGATNLPPSTPATPSKWISVQVSGESTVYRLPLYQ